MTITTGPDLEKVLRAVALGRGITPEQVALEALRSKFLPPMPEPRDEWERRLFGLAVDCGVVLSDEDMDALITWLEYKSRH